MPFKIKPIFDVKGQVWRIRQQEAGKWIPFGTPDYFFQDFISVQTTINELLTTHKNQLISNKTMKPSQKRIELKNAGKVILRTMARHSGNGTHYVIAAFNGFGWPNWNHTEYYKTEDQAYKALEKVVREGARMYVDDRTIKK